MAEHLSAVNANPIEGRVRECVAREASDEYRINGGSRSTHMLFHDNFCVKKYFIPSRKSAPEAAIRDTQRTSTADELRIGSCQTK